MTLVDFPINPQNRSRMDLIFGAYFFVFSSVCILRSLRLSSILDHQLPLGLGPSLADFLRPVPGTLPGI